jgi:hypothetical protein
MDTQQKFGTESDLPSAHPESDLARMRWVAATLRRLNHPMEAAAVEFRLHLIEDLFTNRQSTTESRSEEPKDVRPRF